MASTTFVKGTEITKEWLNDVNPLVYGASDVAKGSALLQYAAETTGSVISTVQTRLRASSKLITDYPGVSTSATAAANTIGIQAAIDANYGKVLIIPLGTFNVATTGSTAAPCGDALSIVDEITLVFEGIIKGTNNCNVFHVNAGAQDVVTFLYEGGGVEGLDRVWVSTYASANANGALLKFTAGIPRIYQIKLINPVQYAVYSDNATEGHIAEVDLIGGWDTYDATRVLGPDNNNFGIGLFNGSLGWKIDGLKTVANAAGGKISQAIGSDTAAGLGVSNKTQVINCRLRNQHEKGIYLFGEDTQVNNNHVVACANGEAIRVIGARPQVNNNLIGSCDGGAITMYDAGGAVCMGNQISDIRGSAITLAYYADEVIGAATLDHALIQGNNIEMDSGMANGGRAIDVRIGIDVAAGDVASTEHGIRILDNKIFKANYHSSDPLAAIDFSAFNTASVYSDLHVERNLVHDSGAVGIRFGAAVYSYAVLKGNKVVDPAQSIARSAYVFETGVAMTGQEISNNEARKDNGANAMTYGFENKTATSQIQSCLIERNNSRGHGTAGYLNMQHATNSRFANRQGDSTLTGSFTCTAGATTAITNVNAQAGMRVALFPTNASAVALQGHASGGLYFGGTLVAGTNFTLASTGGVAAGTETFDYEINV